MLNLFTFLEKYNHLCSILSTIDDIQCW